MNVTGTTSPLNDLLPATRDPRLPSANAARTVADSAATRVVPAPSASAAPAGPHSTTGLSAQAPAGTDPALWGILTAEERLFFTRQASSGPLTYLKVMMPNSVPSAPAAARGRRIDVRV
jgi:hypothetical protein